MNGRMDGWRVIRFSYEGVKPEDRKSSGNQAILSYLCTSSSPKTMLFNSSLNMERGFEI